MPTVCPGHVMFGLRPTSKLSVVYVMGGSTIGGCTGAARVRAGVDAQADVPCRFRAWTQTM